MTTTKQFFEIAEEASAKIKKISDFIHANPEIGFHEVQASRLVAEFLQNECHFQVEHPAFALETAVFGKWTNLPQDNLPQVCVIAEYDALKGIGHACGHNLIAAAALSAAWTASVYATRNHIPIRLCLMGTPAEEQWAGKVKLINNGAFKGIDMAIMAHGSGFTETDEGSLGVSKCNITFHGKSSHAASSPQAGINALDSMVLFYHHMLQWKKNIHPADRVHGIITHGGDAPNAIPDRTTATFYVRSPEWKRLPELRAKLEESIRFGAEQIGCTYEIDWFSTDMPILINRPINDRYAAYWEETGKKVIHNTGKECRASTDMGDVTHLLPGAQLRFSTTGETPCPLHSEAFKASAATPEAFQNALQSGAIMARILLDYSTDTAFRKQVDDAFKQASRE